MRVVGFRVEPYSIKHVYDENIDFSVKTTQLNTCSAQRPARNDPTNYQRIDGSTEVVFTYDVEWEDSATPWSHRWDVFLQGNPDDKIHWSATVWQSKFGEKRGTRRVDGVEARRRPPTPSTRR